MKIMATVLSSWYEKPTLCCARKYLRLLLRFRQLACSINVCSHKHKKLIHFTFIHQPPDRFQACSSPSYQHTLQHCISLYDEFVPKDCHHFKTLIPVGRNQQALPKGWKYPNDLFRGDRINYNQPLLAFSTPGPNLERWYTYIVLLAHPALLYNQIQR